MTFTTRYEQCFNRLMELEGRSATDNKHDRGGLTYWGITRRAHPDWIGWQLLQDGATPEAMHRAVQCLYYDEYWVKVGGDGHKTDDFAFELFEYAVNSGVGSAIRSLQFALNLVGDDLDRDGKLGLKTKQAIEKIGEDVASKLLNVEQAVLFRGLVISDPTQAGFYKGWIGKRVKI